MGQIAGSEIFRGSLWIRPQGVALEQIQHAMQRARDRCGGPAAHAHVSILGGIELPADDARRRLERLADGFLPFNVRLGRLDWYDEYYRSFFARVDASPELLSLYRRAQEVFDIHPRDAYEPHVSLIYGDVRADRKKDLAIDLGGMLDVSFQANALCLVDATGEVPIEQWHTVFQARFNGAPSGVTNGEPPKPAPGRGAGAASAR
jgi:hypothetical protein